MITAVPNDVAIQRQALNLLAQCNITSPPVIAADLAKQCGFDVLCAVFDPDNVAGLLDVEHKRILVNSADSPVQQNFTIAHELGHYLLKHHEREGYEQSYAVLLRTPDIKDETPMEQEANWFAENLLVPTVFLHERLAKYPFLTNQRLARMFGVPVRLMNLRRLYT